MNEKILGVKVNLLEDEAAFEKIVALGELNKPTQVILLDTFLLMRAKLSKKLFELINASDLVIPVSPGIRIGMQFLKKKQCPIHHPHKFTIRLLSYLEEQRKIVYIVGGNKKMIQKTEKNIKDSYPGILLMGTHHIKYKKDFESKLLTNIQKISPALTIVSMSRPKQEKWIYKNRHFLKKGVVLGVESFVDYVAEKDLPPFDRMFHSFKLSIKNFVRVPFQVCNNSLYIWYLLMYKIFGFHKKDNQN